MSGSGRGSAGCSGMVDRPSWMSQNGREALPDVRQLLGGPPGYPGVIGRPSRISMSGWEALTNVHEWSGGPPG